MSTATFEANNAGSSIIKEGSIHSSNLGSHDESYISGRQLLYYFQNPNNDTIRGVARDMGDEKFLKLAWTIHAITIIDGKLYAMNEVIKQIFHKLGLSEQKKYFDEFSQLFSKQITKNGLVNGAKRPLVSGGGPVLVYPLSVKILRDEINSNYVA